MKNGDAKSLAALKFKRRKMKSVKTEMAQRRRRTTTIINTPIPAKVP